VVNTNDIHTGQHSLSEVL